LIEAGVNGATVVYKPIDKEIPKCGQP